MKFYIKRKELEYEILKINNIVKKYIIMENDNQKVIRELEENLSYKNMDIKLKNEEFIKLNEILEKIDIENNNYIFPTEIKIINKNNKDKEEKNENIKIRDNKNIKEKQNEIVINKANKEKEKDNLNIKKNNILNEFNKNVKPKNIIQSHPEINIKELNNRYSIKKEKKSITK